MSRTVASFQLALTLGTTTFRDPFAPTPIFLSKLVNFDF